MTRAERAAAQAKSDRTHELRVMRVYGLEPGQYARMLAEQFGRCAICMKQPRSKRLSVDHDHTSGRVRGLLCQPCNRGLRSFEFEVYAASNAAAYLESIAADLHRHAQERQAHAN